MENETIPKYKVGIHKLREISKSRLQPTAIKITQDAKKDLSPINMSLSGTSVKIAQKYNSSLERCGGRLPVSAPETRPGMQVSDLLRKPASACCTEKRNSVQPQSESESNSQGYLTPEGIFRKQLEMRMGINSSTHSAVESEDKQAFLPVLKTGVRLGGRTASLDIDREGKCSAGSNKSSSQKSNAKKPNSRTQPAPSPAWEEGDKENKSRQRPSSTKDSESNPEVKKSIVLNNINKKVIIDLKNTEEKVKNNKAIPGGNDQHLHSNADDIKRKALERIKHHKQLTKQEEDNREQDKPGFTEKAAVDAEALVQKAKERMRLHKKKLLDEELQEKQKEEEKKKRYADTDPEQVRKKALERATFAAQVAKKKIEQKIKEDEERKAQARAQIEEKAAKKSRRRAEIYAINAILKAACDDQFSRYKQRIEKEHSNLATSTSKEHMLHSGVNVELVANEEMCKTEVECDRAFSAQTHINNDHEFEGGNITAIENVQELVQNPWGPESSFPPATASEIDTSSRSLSTQTSIDCVQNTVHPDPQDENGNCNNLKETIEEKPDPSILYK